MKTFRIMRESTSLRKSINVKLHEAKRQKGLDSYKNINNQQQNIRGRTVQSEDSQSHKENLDPQMRTQLMDNNCGVIGGAPMQFTHILVY